MFLAGSSQTSVSQCRIPPLIESARWQPVHLYRWPFSGSAPDVLHRDIPQARRDALLGVDALVETVVGLAAPDMNDRDDALPVQVLVVRRRVVATVGNHDGGLEPWVQGLRPGYHRRQLRRVVSLRSRDKVGQGHSVVGVGQHVHLVAVVPFLALLLCPGTVLGRPGRLRVADALTVGAAVAPDRGGVYRNLGSKIGNQRLELVGEVGKAGFHEVNMMGEALDEAVEGGAMGQRAKEAAEMAEGGFIFQTADQGVGVGQVQDEGGDVGSPEGLEGVAVPARGPVLLQTRQERIVAQAGENCGQLAEIVLCIGKCSVTMRQRHLETVLPCG